jgi:hypothetical protein
VEFVSHPEEKSRPAERRQIVGAQIILRRQFVVSDVELAPSDGVLVVAQPPTPLLMSGSGWRGIGELARRLA